MNKNKQRRMAELMLWELESEDNIVQGRPLEDSNNRWSECTCTFDWTFDTWEYRKKPAARIINIPVDVLELYIDVSFDDIECVKMIEVL